MGGERGLISYIEKNHLKALKFEEKILSRKIETLEFKISLLTNEQDLDFIEILIRKNFLFGKKMKNSISQKMIIRHPKKLISQLIQLKKT